jgi:hypothetical protein
MRHPLRDTTGFEAVGFAVAIALMIAGVVLTMTASPGKIGLPFIAVGVLANSYFLFRQLSRRDLEDASRRAEERKLRRLGQ